MLVKRDRLLNGEVPNEERCSKGVILSHCANAEYLVNEENIFE